ncbi:MAG: hypothetical protein ACTTI6_00100 [Treponema sp.]|uniref:hypothetical protein n=1 Tax=Treponema sp. TaxID=166 RepID=UPI003FA1B5BC
MANWRKDRMKIIYIFERRHCYTYDNKMFQYEFFLKQGHSVEAWSIVNWTFPQKVEMPLNADTSKYVHYINNEKDLKVELERIKKENCIFLCYPYHAYNYISYLVRKHIKQYSFQFCNITESPEVSAINHKFEQKINIFIIVEVCIKFLLRLGKNLLLLRFDKMRNIFFSFCGPFICKSKKNFITVPLMYYHFPNVLECLSKRNIVLHSESYDEFLTITAVMTHEKIIADKYVVFIDQYVTGHSDWKKLKLKYPISNKQAYFSQLCYLFNAIEKKMKCKVVIAAHPKAEYIGGEFGDRDILYGQSNVLIRDAEFVIIQFSTLFGYVCLSEKKFLTVYSEEMFENVPSLKNDYGAIVNIFGNKLLDIANKTAVNLFFDYIFEDKDRCSQYINNYVISDKSVYRNRLFYDGVYQELFAVK